MAVDHDWRNCGCEPCIIVRAVLQRTGALIRMPGERPLVMFRAYLVANPVSRETVCNTGPWLYCDFSVKTEWRPCLFSFA